MKSPLSSTTDIPAFMETPHEADNSKAFIEASAPAHTSMNTADDFSANSANPCTIKEEELSACRKGGPTSRIRQAIFCKRRNGLFKKAHELSVLCDAEVAAVVFSTSGKKSEFASSRLHYG